MLRIGIRKLGLVARHCGFSSQVLAILAACAVMIAVPVGDAYASAKQCKSLSRQLASLSGGNSRNFKKYDRAVKRQATELNRAKRQYRSNKCNFFSGGKCATIRQTLRKMDSNYRALARKRDRYAGGTSSKKRAIKARMASLRCGKKPSVVAKRKNSRSKSVVVRRGEPRARITVPPVTLGGYRTMCVRTCDGYYFPVSHASRQSDFARDERICSALCPASESKLFVYKNSDEESEDMISLRGDKYTALPTAFKYRTQSRNPSCTCGRANPEAVGLSTGKPASKGSAGNSDPFLKRLPPPRYRPDLYADIESQHNESSGLTAKIIRQFLGSNGTGDIIASANERKVRVVGAEFLPDPKEAINLRAPAPTTVQ